MRQYLMGELLIKKINFFTAEKAENTEENKAASSQGLEALNEGTNSFVQQKKSLEIDR